MQLSRREVSRIIAQHYDKPRPKTISQLSGGVDSLTYRIALGKSDCVLKLIPRIKKPELEFQLAVMNECSRLGFPIPSTLGTKRGNGFANVRNGCILLMDFMKGKPLSEFEVSAPFMRRIARILAEMDLKLKKFIPPGKPRNLACWGIENFGKTKKLLPCLKHLPHIDPSLIKNSFAQFNSIKSKLCKCPRGLVHNDFTVDNILTNGKEITGIVDFGDVAISHYIVNLAIAVADIALEQRDAIDKARIFFLTYNGKKPLSAREKRLLYALVNVRLSTEVLNYAKLFSEERKPAYRAEAYCADRKMKLLNKLGEQRFNKALGI